MCDPQKVMVRKATVTVITALSWCHRRDLSHTCRLPQGPAALLDRVPKDEQALIFFLGAPDHRKQIIGPKPYSTSRPDCFIYRKWIFIRTHLSARHGEPLQFPEALSQDPLPLEINRALTPSSDHASSVWPAQLRWHVLSAAWLLLARGEQGQQFIDPFSWMQGKECWGPATRLSEDLFSFCSGHQKTKQKLHTQGGKYCQQWFQGRGEEFSLI